MQKAKDAGPIVVTGLGHWVPDHVIDNDFFDSLDIGSSASWIEDRVGIKQRRSVLPASIILALRRGELAREELARTNALLPLAKMCVEPWAKAHAQAQLGMRGLSVDHVLCGTSVPDYAIPANACAIAAELGISAAAFDVNSACSSFVVNLHAARGLLSSGMAERIAIFNPERYSTRMDFADRSASVLFGDGATCAIVERGIGHGLQVVDTVVHSDPTGYRHVLIPDGGLFSQNGHAVQKFAVTRTVQVAREILERHALVADDVRFFIGHQANLRMLVSACDKLGIKPEQHAHNVERFGNQGAAGAPSVLTEIYSQIQPGDRILIAVVGSGLTWGAALLQAS